MFGKNRNIVIAGDFNFPPNDIDIKSNEFDKNLFNTDREWFESLIKLGFEDCFRFKNPDVKFYSTNTKYALPGLISASTNNRNNVRTSLILANTEFIEKHVYDCYYLDFKNLKYPDPKTRDYTPIEMDETLKTEEKDSDSFDKLQSDDEETKKQFKVKNTKRTLKVPHLPVVLSTDIIVRTDPLPSIKDLEVFDMLKEN